MGLSRPVARVLRASVSTDERSDELCRAWRAVPPDGLDALRRAAIYHGVPGYVWSGAQACGEDSGRLADLKTLVERAVLQHLRTLGDLGHLAEALDGASVPWLVVKGPVLAETLHAGPELRSYADLDVLVPPERLRDALDALEVHGGTLQDRNWTLIGREMKGEVHVRLPLGTVADLHWSLLNDRAVREQYTVSTNALLDRSRTVTVGGRQVRTLDEIDTVVYLALHTMLSGGHRLLWLKDVALALDRAGATSAEIRDRARSWGAELALAAAAGRTCAAIGSPASRGSLTPSGLPARVWVAASAGVWRLVPAEREAGGGSLGRMVARSVRPTASASARVLAGKTRSYLWDSNRGAAPARKDPGSPTSDRYDAGGDPAREAYLDAVEREASQ